MNVNFGGGIANEKVYVKSFGGLSNETSYYDPMNTSYQGADLTVSSNSEKAELKSKIDGQRLWMQRNVIESNAELKSRFNAETKSFTADLGGAGTTDNVMNPIYLDRDIVDTSRKQTPMRAIIRRVTNQGIKAVYNIYSSKSTASFQGELEPQVTSDFTPERTARDVKIIRVSGYTSGFAQASVPSFNLQDIQGTNTEFGEFSGAVGSTAMDQNVLQATRAIQEFEEDAIFNGDNSSDSKAFDGIIQLQGTTNMTNKSGASLTLAELDDVYFNAYSAGGRPNLAVCDVVTYKKVKQLLQDKGGFLEYKDLGVYGFKALMIKAGDTDIPLIPSRFLSTTAAAQRLYMLDLSVWEMRVLLDLTFEMLAKVDDGQKFMLKMYEVLVDKSNAAFNSGLYGMTN
jgi:hypothetical protein